MAKPTPKAKDPKKLTRIPTMMGPIACGGSQRALIRTRRIGANPEKSDLVNFRGPD